MARPLQSMTSHAAAGAAAAEEEDTTTALALGLMFGFMANAF